MPWCANDDFIDPLAGADIPPATNRDSGVPNALGLNSETTDLVRRVSIMT